MGFIWSEWWAGKGRWEVEVGAPYTYGNWPKEGMGTDKLVGSYSSDMNSLIKAYKKARGAYKDDTYYLFVIPAFQGDGVTGPMIETSKINVGQVYRGNAQQYEFIEALGEGKWKTYFNQDIVKEYTLQK